MELEALLEDILDRISTHETERVAKCRWRQGLHHKADFRLVHWARPQSKEPISHATFDSLQNHGVEILIYSAY